MAEQRLPLIDGDDGEWGEILNQFIEKEHYNTGSDNTANGQHKTVTIRPGTTAAGTAPLKFASGSLMTTPEAGAVEFLTDRLYFTITTGTVRKTIAAYNDASGATGDIYYRDSGGDFTRLGIGSSGDVLTVSGGLPAWSTDTSVKLSGDQTIAGVKTFSSSPVVPTPTTDMQAATKKYVDDNAGGVTIGDSITGSTANRMLYLNGSNELANDLISTYYSDIDVGGGLHIYSRGFSDPTYATDGSDPALGFLDLSDVGGGKNILANVGTGTGSMLWSDGANTIASIDDSGFALTTGERVNEFSSDTSLAGNSNTAVPTEQAVKSYADTKLSDVVDDTTPQLGGNLDLNSQTINGTGAISYTGNLTLVNGDLDMNDTSTNRIFLPAGTTSQPAVQFAGTIAGMAYEAGALLFVNSSGTVTFRAGPSQVFFAMDMRSYVNANGFDIISGTGLGQRIYGTRRTGWTQVGYGFHATETYAPAVYSQNSGGTKQMNMWWGQSQETVAMGDVEVSSSSNGIILKSPDNTRWRVTIDNSGNLVTTAL